MNKPSRPVAAPPAVYPDYAGDGYGWAMAQGKLLRERRIDAIDWDNVAEEIETMGRSERNEYVNHMIRVLTHMIKWEVQPDRRGLSWWLSIMNGRDDAERILVQNPSLKPQLDDLHNEALRYAQRKAVAETGLDRDLIDAVAISRDDAMSGEIDRPEGD